MPPAFQQIPNDLRVPGFYIEFEGVPSNSPEDGIEPVLIMAPMLSTGTATANEPTRIVSTQEAWGLLGRGSIGHRMVQLFRENNPLKELWVMPLADADGATKALWTLRLETNGPLSGVLSLYIGGQLVDVPVTTDEAADDILEALLDRIDDLPDLLIERVSGPTAITQVFTTTHGTETINATAHGLDNGQRITVANTGGALPAGLVAATEYTVTAKTDNTFTLLDSAGAAVTLSDDGTGVHTLTWVDGFTATVRMRNAGTLGNDLNFRLNYKGSAAGEVTPTGVALTWATTTPGATDPSLTDAITAMGDEPYDYIVCPWALATPLDGLKTKVDSRWLYNAQIYGHVFSAKRETSANLLTFGATRNGIHETVFGIYDYPSPVFEVLAAAVGQLALTLDADPAMPEHSLQLSGILPPKMGSTGRFTMDVRDALLKSGIATLTVVRQTAFLERAINTYQEDAQGNTDTTFLDIQTPFTMMRMARFMRTQITTKFRRKKLADDDNRLPATSNVVTPSMVRNECIAIYNNFIQLGWAEDLEWFKDNLDVVRNANPNRLDILFPPDFVNQFRQSATLFRFRL